MSVNFEIENNQNVLLQWLGNHVDAHDPWPVKTPILSNKDADANSLIDQ